MAVRIAVSNSETPHAELLRSNVSPRFIVEEADACTATYFRFADTLSWEEAERYVKAIASFSTTIEMAPGWDPLTSDTLEKDLDLTPAQKVRIDDLRSRYKSEEELWRSHSLLESEVDRKLEELQDRYRALIRRELSPEQQRKLDELEAATWRGRLASSRSRTRRYVDAVQRLNP